MEFGWPEELEAFRARVRALIAERRTPELAAESDAVSRYTPADPPDPETPQIRALMDEVARRGWSTLSLPAELGGQGQSPWYQYILSYELRAAGIPFDFSPMTLFAPAIMRFGTEEQKQEYIPRIWNREITLALGYSEPGAGSDLASLKTRAVRDGDDYVINGQKIWTSEAHARTHVWLAVRTDPEAPKHRGISVLIVPLTTPGISIRPIWTMAGVRTNEVFYEDVRVPRTALIGEENRGWYVIANALDSERMLMGIQDYLEITFIYDKLRTHLADEEPEKLANPVVRRRMAELKMDIAAQRALLLTNATIVARGELPNKEASMVKVWGTELRHRVASTAMDIVGRRSAFRRAAGELAAADGRLEASYRYAPVLRFAGGTNEVQRNIIAQRGLELPR